MINKLRDTEKKEILYRKYIKGETLEQIGEEMGISSRHVQRLINTAIETLVGGRQ
jgi:RNA polymerase sigma factor (sigma-70 family)